MTRLRQAAVGEWVTGIAGPVNKPEALAGLGSTLGGGVECAFRAGFLGRQEITWSESGGREAWLGLLGLRFRSTSCM